jgi:C-terminal processing protease CtpA/Prc
MRTLKPLIVSMLVLVFMTACQEEEPTATPQPLEAVEEAPVKNSTNTPEPIEEPIPTNTTMPDSDDDTSAGETSEPTPVDELPQIEVSNDEGGAVSITGVVTYTNPFFTMGVAQPVIILEDQAGFVDRDESFLMPPESQTLGQITSDFFVSPFEYSISLPIEPQGTLRDVDNDGQEDPGVQVFAVAYWTNTFGDPFLEVRDLSGGGWSTAYASTLVSDDADTEREIVGGKFLIYAPDEHQGFPSGFGDDGLLFTEDDPIVNVKQGYTVVDLDTDPFTFDRSSHPVINLIEPESTALVDYSDLSYPEAFEGLVDQLSREYAFTEFKGIDWDVLREEFLPRFEEAVSSEDVLAYRRALRDFAWSIPDGHISGPQVIEDFREATAGGLGLAFRETDDGRTIVNFLTPGGPAEVAGIELGAEIMSLNGQDIEDAIMNAVAYSAPFSTEHFERLQQLRYATRFPLGSEVDISWKNPESDTLASATLTVEPEAASFNFSSFNVNLDGFEQPLEYDLLEDEGLGYVQVYSFADNELLTIQLWERLIRNLNDNAVPGLIIDMRQNGGGDGFLADQMAAYFFNESLDLGNLGRYDDDLEDFYFDPRQEDRFYLPAEELRYNGEVAVIVGPNCASACEFFTYAMTLEDRSAIVGQYPTAGLGGSIQRVAMPEGEFFTFTEGRAVDADGNIHIEGQGIPPTVLVPVNEETLLTDGDPVLDAAITHLLDALVGEIIEGGEVALGDEISGTLEPGSRVRYLLPLKQGDTFSLELVSQDFAPVLALLDEDGNLLGTTAGQPEAIVDELEAPVDLTLILDILAEDDNDGGDYLLHIFPVSN